MIKNTKNLELFCSCIKGILYIWKNKTIVGYNIKSVFNYSKYSTE